MPFGAQIKGRECGEKEPRPLAPAQDSWGFATPCVGSMADVAMESEGKAAGGWAAAAHLGVFVIAALKTVKPKRKTV